MPFRAGGVKTAVAESFGSPARVEAEVDGFSPMRLISSARGIRVCGIDCMGTGL